MQQLRVFARYYVKLLVKLGLVRFSLLLALMLIICAIVVQIAVTWLLGQTVSRMDLLRSVCFGLLVTPWASYFLSIVVEQLEQSRRRLTDMVLKLKQLRLRDQQLNQQLTESVKQLNQAMAAQLTAQAEQQATQLQLEKKSSLLESFLDACPDLVYYRNEQSQYMGCNRAMELLTGKSQKQLLGLTPAQLYPAPIAQKISETDEIVFHKNITATYEQWLPYPDGRQVCFEIRKVPFYDRFGKRQGLMGFGRDITQHKHYQDALEQASQEKTSFISTISHELRTPLNAIVGLSRLLLESPLSAQQQDYLQSIYVSAVTLGTIFSDVIDIDKVERNCIQIQQEPVEVAVFIRDLANIARLLVEQKGLTFQLKQQQPLPVWVTTDATRLRQILWNLINNSVKFTQQGQVVIEITYQWTQQQWQLVVMDTGVGIPLDEQEKIFQMYYQGTQQTRADGTGIGLSISRYLAQAMGGNLTVNSSAGQGARFTCQVNAPVMTAALPIAQELPLLPALHVLLVEDIAVNAMIAQSILEKLGSTVVLANDGQTALTRFAEDEFDLILLDIQLPDISGLAVVEQLKQRYGKSQLPIIVALTANGTQDKADYYAAGIDEVLAKPITVEALVQLIGRLWSVADVAQQLPSLPAEQVSYLDEQYLQQYYQLVGKQQLVQTLQLFEQSMPNYLTNMEYYLSHHQWQQLADEGHKVKGAAGTIGLTRIQQLAQIIQNKQTSSAWQQQANQAMQTLEGCWLADMALIKQWLAKK